MKQRWFLIQPETGTSTWHALARQARTPDGPVMSYCGGRWKPSQFSASMSVGPGERMEPGVVTALCSVCEDWVQPGELE